ncbi:MAG: Hsp20/alpha crystallin family protein [Candidatus Bipolaricaulaceae bacterium]
MPTVWREPFLLTSRMGRLMDELFKDFTPMDWDVTASFGRSDIYVKDKTLVVETELPGARREDVKVRVEDDQLVITGEVKRSEEIREENYIRMGRRYGSFRRAFPLPEGIEDKKKIKARFENGILRVELPLQRPVGGEVHEVKVD